VTEAGIDEPALIRLVDLKKSFGKTEVLRGVSLDVARGEVIAIIGASGSGKSTLLRCINLLEPPSEGELWFDQEQIDYGRIDRRRLRRLRSQIGMVFQSYNLWPHMTVLENVIEAPVTVKGLAKPAAIARAEELLARIGLAEKRHDYPSRLSGGQQQRVAVVRALAMAPKAMLFDEVTSALDPELVGEVLDLLGELAHEGMTMLVVTHEIAFARDVSNRTFFVDQGVIAEAGPSQKMLSQPQNERTRQFLRRVLHSGAGMTRL
jgi:polar amino acid transport system ATP-binding protein